MDKKSKTYTSFIRNVALMLAILNAGIIFSQTFFIHKHVLDNGEVVYHSHPYKKSDNSSTAHNHDSFTLHILPTDKVLNFEISPYVVFDYCVYLELLTNYIHPEVVEATHNFLRAPPLINS